MAQLPEVLVKYQAAFIEGDLTSMKSCYAHDVVYFDPLYNYLHGDQVASMWVVKFADMESFKISVTNTTDEGDGYFKMQYNISFLSMRHRSIVLSVKSFFKIDGDKIAEQSEAFSLHTLLKQERGVAGYLMGWNRFMQQARKNKARKSLLNFLSLPDRSVS